MATKRDEQSQKAKKLHTTAVRLDDQTLKELRELAAAEMRPLANLIAVLIHEALESRRKVEK
jgi:predicted DNA-binding ribbon-helix-helix protein